jgi:hypothetical protein
MIKVKRKNKDNKIDVIYNRDNLVKDKDIKNNKVNKINQMNKIVLVEERGKAHKYKH